MSGYGIAKHTPIRTESLDPNQYTLSLLKEGFRVGLVDRQTIYGIQEQVMLILRDLITRYTKGESTSLRTETAESLLNSIYYSIDAYAGSFEDPEQGIAVLKTANMKEIYDKGVEIIESIFKEARQLCQEIVRNKLDVPLEVYNTSVTEDLPEFFEQYSIIFGAHDTAGSFDYPLIFDDMNVRGVLYIRNYLGNLDIETQFCRLFDKQDINKTLAVYGRTCRIDYKESPVNLFEVLVNNSIFSALSGNAANELRITGAQYEIIRRKLTGLDYLQMNNILNAAVEKLIGDLHIDQPKLADYIHRYKKGLGLRVLNAVNNNNLNNIVMISTEGKSQNTRDAFIESERLSDDSFSLIVQRIINCTNAADKVTVIMTSVRSLEDFIDILNADCLFEDEFEAVFAALGNMELAVLAKTIFLDELRVKKLDLPVITVDNWKASTEWESAYIRFIQGLNKERKTAIEEYASHLASID
ncbi:MAG: hypothetical protein APF77_20780 [Clostridia bacterium BRH_c25]|nr:MAG: hypothetical protein APF77_20780 [Clostridia bacterium BRH_c25]